jgi:TolB-like protein
MSLFTEIRQRRLFQVVVSYLAAGWIALEVVDQLTQQEIIPVIAYQIALVWYLAGIPAAFLVGWHHGEKGRQRAPKSELAMLFLLGAGVLGFTGLTLTDHVSRERARAAAEASALALDRIAVLYFEDYSPDGALEPVAAGLTEGLIEELRGVRGFDVVSRNGTAPYRGTSTPPDSIASALRAGTLVRGSVEQAGENVRVNVALLEGETGAPFGRRASFERPGDDLFAIQDELAAEVARQLREWMGDEVRLRRRQRGTASQAAWVLLQRAEKARVDAESAVVHDEPDAAEAAFARADSLLEQVRLLDDAWVAPVVMAGELDYRRARLGHDAHERADRLDAGLAHAATALDLDPDHAGALGLRGRLRYLQYIWHLLPHDADMDRARDAARADLEKAVDIDPTQASAWSALQHLYYGSSLPDAVMAGERAYEEDAYLEAAEEILWRLYTGHFDLENFLKAREFCLEGNRRFDRNPRFTNCQLELMHTGAIEPDPDRAWALAGRIDSLAGDHRRAYADVEARIFVGGALARAGMRDSAMAVLDAAVDDASAEIDPERELLTFAAAMYSVAGDDDRAIDLLKRNLAANPGASFSHHWWYRSIRNHPRYPEIAPADH